MRPSIRPENLEALVLMKYNLRGIGYSLDLPPTPPGFVVAGAMGSEAARAGNENSCDVEDELDFIH